MISVESELLYVYMENVNDCFVDQGINFSDKYVVDFKSYTGNLEIDFKKSSIRKSIFGEQIRSINLIVGKNGSGKSTILDLLGFKDSDRKHLLRNSKSKRWFALYSLSENRYVLEGNQISLIKNIKGMNLKEISQTDYSIIVSYENRKLYFESFIQFRGDNRKTIYTYNPVRRYESWYEDDFIYSESLDSFIGYERTYLNTPSMYSIFNEIISENNDKQKQFTAKNTNIIFTKRNIFEDNERGLFTTIKEEEINEVKESLNLYNNNVKPFILNSSCKTKDDFLNENWSKKEIFIIEFLEESIYYKFLDSHKNVRYELRDKVNSHNFFGEDTFENRKKYLNSILSTIHGKSSGISIESKYQEITDIFIEIDEVCYVKKNQINTNILKESKGISRLIKFYDTTEEEHDVYPLKVEFSNLSTGELQFVKHFAGLQKLNDITSYSNFENIIILLDEPDSHFHPEWSRRYIAKLINFLNERVVTKKNVKFQLIITTHSPFMISDIPKEYINCIDIIKTDTSVKRKIFKADFGLMSNFYDLIKHNFFMNSPIGEYASIIFSKLINDIKKINSNTTSVKISEIQEIVSLIDDPLIKKHIQNIFNEKINSFKFFEVEKMKDRIKEIEIEKQKLEKKLKSIRQERDFD